MPRPSKKRRVCCNPGKKIFGPKGIRTTKAIILTVDEYEALRLIDVEDMKQEECAESMNVARSTVQSIYSSARKKLSTALVSNINLKVEGGDYIICEEADTCCRKDSCCESNEDGSCPKVDD